MYRLYKKFHKGPLKLFLPLYEAVDGFLFSSHEKTRVAPFVRDCWDMKRVMVYVIIALLPCLFTGIWNAGFQALSGIGRDPGFLASFLFGIKLVFPLILVTYAVGGFWEVLFAIVRKREINEGFLVTGLLFVLTLPPSIPLWQAALGISFGVVIGKEIFGGTGMNFINPALAGRAFIFFAYPASISGNTVWTAAVPGVDIVSRPTPLSLLKEMGQGTNPLAALSDAGYSFSALFWGGVPGSIGETSAAACLAGMIFLVCTGIVSWRIIAGCIAGLLGSAALINHLASAAASQSSALMLLPPSWHLMMGGFALGAVFMATDPVSSCSTNEGRWIYGLSIGALVVLIRVFNPAYPEGVMLAILFMNVFAPLIDHVVVGFYKRRRRLLMRQGTGNV